MKIRLLIFALLAGLALAPAAAYAQSREDDSGDGGFIFRADGDLVIPAGQRVETAIVAGGDARIAGEIGEFLMVINGDAVVTGRVDGDVTVIRGDLDLRAGSEITGDVNLIRSDIRRAPGATVGGDITEEDGWGLGWWWAIAPVYFWVAFTILMVLTGLIFAAVGGRQLTAAAMAISDSPGQSILGAVILILGIPLLAVLAFVTLVGIPFGLGLLLFVVPALLFLGYVVTATRVGIALTGAMKRESPARPEGHPYLAAFVGVLVFQLVALVPVLGALAVIVGGILGAGALLYTAWSAWRGPGTPVTAEGGHAPGPMPAPQPR